ncbi:MAG: PHB depolymerase family esterase [Bradymonadia bacterium]
MSRTPGARRLTSGWLGLMALGLMLTTEAGAQGWSTDTWGGVRANVYAPAAQGRLGSGRGLLIVLHGCSQSPDALRDQGSWDSAEEYGVVMAIPFVPNGGVVAQCWDYYDGFHTRQGKHTGPLLSMIDALLGDASLGIDPRQVYVSGLSSGATQAMLLGCLAPDVIAGVSSVAGPAPGTGIAQIAAASGTPDSVASTCRNFAGQFADDFRTQLASIAYGTQDAVVAQGYGPINAGAFASIYADGGGALQQGQFDVGALPGEGAAGQGTIWSDNSGPRVTLLQMTGANHAWPAGNGNGGFGGFVEGRGVDYAAYLVQFFSENNRRVDGGGLEPPPPAAPSVAQISGRAIPEGIRVEGRATPAGRIVTVEITLEGPGGTAQQVPVDGAGSFSASFTGLDAGATYVPVAVAIDVDGDRSPASRGAPINLAAPADNEAPTVSITQAQAVAGCIRAEGTLVDDVDGATASMAVLATMGVEVDAAEVEIIDSLWQVEICDLEVGCYLPVVKATDAGGLTDEVEWGEVLAVSTGGIVDEAEGTLWQHITRMTREGFQLRVADATYDELEELYGAFEPFTLYQSADGEWYADPSNIPGGEMPDCSDFERPEPPPPPPMGGAGGEGGAGGVMVGGSGGAGGTGGDVSPPMGGAGGEMEGPSPMGGITGEIDEDDPPSADGPTIRTADDGCNNSGAGGSLFGLVVLLGLLRRRVL